MTALTDSLAKSPQLFPHALDVGNDRLAFVELSREDYAQASFLDARILTPHTIRHTFAWAQVAAAVAAAGLPERCSFIFHIGHVGSTLLSRLTGAHAHVFALREPLLLRTFAQLHEAADAPWSACDFDARLGSCLKLFSRTFDPQQRAVAKATSFVSELAPALMMRASTPQALLMYVAAESYLATIFGGPNSRAEARLLAPQRLRRLQRRGCPDAWSCALLSEGETLALSWACEMAALADAARAAGARALPIDFDKFLAAPAAWLEAALRHFSVDVTPAELERIMQGPHLRRYAKAPEHAYDATLRREVLAEARSVHAAQIRRGLAWLERAAGQCAAVRTALDFAATAAR